MKTFHIVCITLFIVSISLTVSGCHNNSRATLNIETPQWDKDYLKWREKNDGNWCIGTSKICGSEQEAVLDAFNNASQISTGQGKLEEYDRFIILHGNANSKNPMWKLKILYKISIHH